MLFDSLFHIMSLNIHVHYLTHKSCIIVDNKNKTSLIRHIQKKKISLMMMNNIILVLHNRIILSSSFVIYFFCIPVCHSGSFPIILFRFSVFV